MSGRIPLLLCAMALCAPSMAGAQAQGTTAPGSAQGVATDPVPVFRSGVESIRFDAFVTDRSGNPVAGLTPDDFQVFEDDVPQTIQQFVPVSLPVPTRGRSKVNTAASRHSSSDIGVNDKDQDRIYVIVLDWMSWQEAVRAARIVERFLENYFTDSDLAAMVTLDRTGPMRFTNDRALLMDQAAAYVRRFADYSPRLPQTVMPPVALAGPSPFPRRETVERASAFGAIAKSLGHINAKRKSIIFISRALEFDPYDAIDMPKSSFAEASRAAMEPIMAASLTVYPIYPGVAGPMQLMQMRALAYVTGGSPSGSDLDKTFSQIVRDNSVYYVLAYDSTRQAQDGSYRHITVKMKRKDLSVRARSGYFVEFPDDPNPPPLLDLKNGRTPKARPFVMRSDYSPAMTEALASPVALTAVPMKVFAAPYKTGSRDGLVNVVVEIPPSGLDLVHEGDTVKGQIDLVVGASFGTSTMRSTGFSYSVDASGEERDQLTTNGLRLQTRLTLSPGKYQLHLAAGNRDGRTGKAFYDLVVPDFSEPMLALSGVSLTSASAAQMLTVHSDTVNAAALTPPTASREFLQAETITVQTEVYENVWWTDAEHLVSLHTTLLAEDGREIPMTSEERSSRAPQRAGGGHEFVAQLPLEKIAPGSYVLHVEARSTFPSVKPTVREISIRVH